MTNREIIKQFISEHGFTRKQTADLLGVPLATLNNWLLPETSKAARRAPEIAVKLVRCLDSHK